MGISFQRSRFYIKFWKIETKLLDEFKSKKMWEESKGHADIKKGQYLVEIDFEK